MYMYKGMEIWTELDREYSIKLKNIYYWLLQYSVAITQQCSPLFTHYNTYK